MFYLTLIALVMAVPTAFFVFKVKKLQQSPSFNPKNHPVLRNLAIALFMAWFGLVAAMVYVKFEGTGHAVVATSQQASFRQSVPEFMLDYDDNARQFGIGAADPDEKHTKGPAAETVQIKLSPTTAAIFTHDLGSVDVKSITVIAQPDPDDTDPTLLSLLAMIAAATPDMTAEQRGKVAKTLFGDKTTGGTYTDNTVKITLENQSGLGLLLVITPP